MNDNLLAQELSALLLENATVSAAIPSIVAAQAGTIMERPSLAIFGEYTPSGADGSFRRGTISFELKSRTATQTAEPPAGQYNHDGRFNALWDFFLGEPGSSAGISVANRAAAKVALIAALDARAKVKLVEYGPAADGAVQADGDETDLVTTLSLRIAWRILPPV